MYVQIDNAGDLVLTTENDTGGPSNVIVLESGVFEALNKYVDRLRENGESQGGAA